MPFLRKDWFGLGLVFMVALGLRAGYVLEVTPGGDGETPWQVQGEGPLLPHRTHAQGQAVFEQRELIDNLKNKNWFGARAPLSDREEDTAALSPGYIWVAALVGSGEWSMEAVLRWGQCLLGALTAVLYLLFARRIFRSSALGFLAGLLTALHPYWIVNTAEVADGVLTTFLLALSLVLAMRSGTMGGPFTSLLFGLVLACLALVRAAMLPFTFVALIWFLPRCRNLPQGWLCALMAFLGFANGLAPWTVRNLQTFEDEPLPIISTAWLHLWMGNNPLANGVALNEPELRLSLLLAKNPWKEEAFLSSNSVELLMREDNQAHRYKLLASHTLNEILNHPGETVNRRLRAGVVYAFGGAWVKNQRLALYQPNPLEEPGEVREWVDSLIPGLLAGSLVLMILLGLWGWRRSVWWGSEVRLALLAAIFLPLPYLLGHADNLVGPRLPLDGIWLTFAALGLGGIIRVDPLSQVSEKGD